MNKYLIILTLLSCSCMHPDSKTSNTNTIHVEESLDTSWNTKGEENEFGKTVATRIEPPTGYKRDEVVPSSFEEYLRNLPLKPRGSKVRYYDGRYKANNDVYLDVVDLDIGNKDLHQCADAVIRLRAEYLWRHEKYDDIHFNFTNGHRIDYSKWMEGNRIQVEGNRSWWVKREEASNSFDDFWKYIEVIFMYAGTASLEKELNPQDIHQAEIGDVFIQGGHPGHAVIIVDKSTDTAYNKTVYLLAQSYMPAQQIHILINPKDKALSPWYSFEHGRIPTPEWTFLSSDLKQFP